MQLTIKNDLDQLQKSMTAIEKKVLPQATLKTLNRVGDSAKSKVIREVSKESGAKQKDIRRRYTFSVRANRSTLYYRIRIRFGAMPLKDFNPVQTKQGVSAKAWGKRKVYKGAFKSDLMGGHVYKRRTKKRLPVDKLWGPIPSRIASDELLEAKVIGLIRERLPREMKSNVKFYTDKYIRTGRYG